MFASLAQQKFKRVTARHPPYAKKCHKHMARHLMGTQGKSRSALFARTLRLLHETGLASRKKLTLEICRPGVLPNLYSQASTGDPTMQKLGSAISDSPFQSFGFSMLAATQLGVNSLRNCFDASNASLDFTPSS